MQFDAYLCIFCYIHALHIGPLKETKDELNWTDAWAALQRKFLWRYVFDKISASPPQNYLYYP